MSLSDAMKKLKFDSRLADYMVKTGQVSETEIQAHLNNLEDVAHNSEKLKIFEGDENGDKESDNSLN